MTKIKKYTKKPPIIEAIQWTGDNAEDIISFVGEAAAVRGGSLYITAYGVAALAPIGSYIVKGPVSGEAYFYPEAQFENGYEEVK